MRTWKRDAEARTLAKLGKAPAVDGAPSQVAELSPAERFGINAKVELKDGTIIPYARPFDVKNEMSELLLLGLPTYALRFLIAKSPNVPSIMLYELRAVVYEYSGLPEGYRHLMYAYPLTVFPYIIDLAEPVESRPRPCVSTVFIPPGEKTPVPFAPLVIDDEVPAVVDVRFNVSKSGVWNFALDAVIMAGISRYTFRVFDPGTVLFE